MTFAARFTLCLVALSPAMTLPSGPARAQPSFDCADARTETEQAICADSDLAELELSMVGVYQDLVARVGNAEARRIADLQLERRQACEGDPACIERQLLTSIGIFRAEARAATSQTQTQPETPPVPAPQPAATSGTEDAQTRRAEARAQGIAQGFARLPEYRRRNVQGRLSAAGLLNGPIDGVWGAGSQAAVEALLEAARDRGRNFPVQNPAGADALYRFIDSDVFYYEFLPETAR